MTSESRHLLVTGGKELGVELSSLQVQALEKLVAELERWNRRINLTAICREEEVVIKHLLDSLSLVPLLAGGGDLLDIGSGAGFPAIPLAIALPQLRVESIDSVAKKITFQRQMVRSLGLTNVTPHHGRAEELAKQRTAAFDWVVARAFSDLLSLGRLARPFLKTGGALLAMKGGEGEQEAEGAADELARLGYASLHCQQLKLPGSNDRRTLVVARLVT